MSLCWWCNSPYREVLGYLVPVCRCHETRAGFRVDGIGGNLIGFEKMQQLEQWLEERKRCGEQVRRSEQGTT